ISMGGFDPGHRFVRLPERFAEVWVEATCCRTGIWVSGEPQGIGEGGSRLRGAFLAKRDEEAWRVLHDFLVLWDLAEMLVRREGDLKRPDRFGVGMYYREPWISVDPRVRMIVGGLDRAVDALDRGGPHAATGLLSEMYERLRGALPGVAVTATGHAHIDLVWLWPERIGEAKAIHTFANAESLMRRYPEFVFGYSQPASYRAVERRSPELMERVRAWIVEGRWEAVGAMEVESDTHLPCGEALARSLLLGQEEFRRLTGSPSRVLWLPDVFGYSAALPRLMRETGVDFFYTTKLAWSAATQFPFTSFRWRGHDGAEVIAHVMGCDQGYNAAGSPQEMMEPVRCHRQVDLHPEVLVPVGYGDGGGGPTEEMCERMRRYADLAGMPSSRWGRIDRFFERLRPLANQLPVWDGEIYLEYHRGVFTTHVGVKQIFRHLERSLQIEEAARAVTGGGPASVETWRRLVFAQFHDDIPGSSIMEVYEEGVPERQALADSCLKSAMEILGGSGCAWFNPLALPQSVLLEDTDSLISVPPLGVASEARPVSEEEGCSWDGRVLRNGRVEAELTECGRIAALRFDGHSVAVREPMGQLCLFKDYPAMFEAWDIDRNTVANPLPGVGVVELVSAGARRSAGGAVYELALTEKSRARVIYRVEAGLPVLKIRYEVEWQDEELLLQAVFPTKYAGQQARFGAPFGSVLRSQRCRSLAADAQFECPASRWAVVADDGEGEGLALVTRDRYGFGCRDGVLHTSLVRSAKVTDADLHQPLRRLRYAHRFSDIGSHVFEVALAWGGREVAREEQPAALADRLFTVPVRCAGHGVWPSGMRLVGGSSLVPAWVKPAEDGRGMVVRLHETRGLRGEVGLDLAEGWRAERTNLRELPGTAIQPGSRFAFGPSDLVSLRLWLEG
ncbi:MAG: glycoside hydrolase family 38 C-terminal domain-containing protein, partial [Verrucomicrobiia bacterium]